MPPALDGKISRNSLYVGVEWVVSSRFALKPIHRCLDPQNDTTGEVGILQVMVVAVRNFAGSLDGTLTTCFGQCRVPCSLEPQNRPQKKTSGLMAQNLLVMLLVPGLLELAGAYPGLTGQELIQITVTASTQVVFAKLCIQGCGKNRQGCWLLALLEVAAAALLEWAALSCTHFRKCKLLFVWRLHGSKRISDL